MFVWTQEWNANLVKSHSTWRSKTAPQTQWWHSRKLVTMIWHCCGLRKRLKITWSKLYPKSVIKNKRENFIIFWDRRVPPNYKNLSTESNFRTIFQIMIDSYTAKYCSVAFIWMVPLNGFKFIYNLRSSNYLVRHCKQYHRKVLLSRFNLSGLTKGFRRQAEKLKLPCTTL